MDVTEIIHNDDHTVDLVVKLEAEELEKSLKRTARRVSKNYRIPGFRPGKAPYGVIEKALGREFLIGEVLDEIGDDMYRAALEEAEIEPYTLGEVKDLDTTEGAVQITFNVAKSPEVTLGAYRDIRIDYELDEITDEDIKKGVHSIYRNTALTEAVDREAEYGDEVVMQLHSFLVNEDEEEAEDDDEERDPHNDDREQFMHEHDYEYVLEEDPDLDMVMPGFAAEVVGAKAGENRVFTLELGDDEDISEELRGRKVEFDITIEKVNARILPPMNDFMATIASDGEFNSVEELNQRVQEVITENTTNAANESYTGKILEELIADAEILYPAAMLENYLDSMIEDFDEGLRRQYGIPLDNYLNMTGQTKEMLREERREQAVRDLKGMLALQEVAVAEELLMSEEDIEAEIDKEVAQYGEMAVALKNAIYVGENRDNFANRLVSDRVRDRLMEIAKGLEPAKGYNADASDDEDTSDDESVEADDAEASDNADDSESDTSE